MAKSEFIQYAEQLVRRQPLPPRDFDWWYSRHLMTSIVTIGPLVLGCIIIFGVLATITSSTSSLNLFGIILFSFLLFGGLFFVAAPLFYIWRWFLALKWGRLEYAQIIELSMAPPGSRSTIESIEHGAAKGRWVVLLQGGQFTENFFVDEWWSQSLHVGSNVRVLVHPRKPKVLMPIGP